MAAISVIAEATTTLDAAFGRFEAIVNKFYERGDIAEDNKVQLARVHRKFKCIQGLLSGGTSFAASNIHAKILLDEMENELHVEFERVVALQEGITSAKRGNRVRRMRQIMNNCENLEDKLIEFLADKAFPTAPTISNVYSYIPVSNVPPNPPRLTLNYANIDTDEGKLKSIILRQQGRRIIAFIASGQGGVGKTCALRGLAEDNDIKTRFNGGLLYIQLGNEAKFADIIDGLANIVHQTGGKHLSEDIRSQESLKEACKMAAPWFSRQSCLFLIDDVWNVNGIDSDIILFLGDIVHGNSRMVYTSRDKYFLKSAEGVIIFQPKKPDGSIARQMLLHHANFSENDYILFGNETASAFNAILKECQGLPLALGIVGGAIFKISCDYEENNKKDVWADYWAEMEKCTTIYDVAKKSNDDVRLRRIVDLSLDVLRKRDKRKDFSSLFRSLCVLRKQQSIPATVLQKLWNQDCIDDTETVITAFADVSLVQMSRNQGTRYVQLHDLVLDIAKHEASRLGEVHGIYNLFIKNYSRLGGCTPPVVSHQSSVAEIESKIDIGRKNTSKSHVKWWDVPPDGYIHRNICSLLHKGERVDELLWLLSQPEWALYRFLNGGVLQVEADLNEGILSLKTSSSSGEHREHLEIIGKAMRLSRTFVYNNPSESWFQLYGRLQWHATINKWTEMFSRRIERVAPRPWVKAPIGVLQQASLHAEGILKSKGRILCIRLERGVVWFVWTSENDIGVTMWDVNADTEKTIKLDLTIFKENGCFERSFHYFLAAFSADGLNVIVVHRSLLVGVFKKETGDMEIWHRLENRPNKPERKIFTCCLPLCQGKTLKSEGEPRFVAMSKDAKYLATSNDEHDVQMWSIADGKKVGLPLRGSADTVICMAISADGTQVVTGGEEDLIRVWNSRNGEEMGSPLSRHTGSVTCLAMNESCSRVVSGARDKSVCVWDMRSGKSIRRFLGHEAPVFSVSISKDGTTVVSGSRDGRVIIWDVKTGAMKGQPLHEHTDGIDHVEISEDGDILVLGSSDLTLRVWKISQHEGLGHGAVGDEKNVRDGVMSADGRRYVLRTGKDAAKVVDTHSGVTVGSPIQIDIEAIECMEIDEDDRLGVFGLYDGTILVFNMLNGEKIGKPLCGHDGWVWCVAVSPDGTRIVSGSKDKTLRIWDVESGKSIGKPLVGHSELIRCVGWSANGCRVVSGSDDNTIRVWDARGGETIAEPLCGHKRWIQCVGLSADGTKVVSGSSDLTVRLWHVQSSQQIGVVFQHDDQVSCLGFNANISKVATICFNGVQKLWDVESESCILTSSDEQWNSEVNRLNLSWNGRFNSFSVRKKIICVDESGNKKVLATTDVGVFHRPGSDIYFSNYSDPLQVVR